MNFAYTKPNLILNNILQFSEELANVKRVLKVDMSKAYYQIPVDQADTWSLVFKDC